MLAKLTRVNGALKIDIDGKIYEPFSFKTFRASDENITDFYNSGIRLFNILDSGRNCAYNIPYSPFGETWLGIGKYDFSAFDKQIELFIKNAPNSYFAIMIDLNLRPWWFETHENYPDTYGWLAQMASDEEWRRETARYIKDAVEYLEEKYGDKIYCYYMLCGIGTEWQSDKNHHQPSHPIIEKYYKEYTNNPDAVIPSAEELELSKEIAFYDKSGPATYHKAYSELIADTIIYFTEKFNEVTKHKKLLGIYYGYLMEHHGPRLWYSGHLAFHKVFESPELDIIASPISYYFRGPDSTGAVMTMQKSLDIHNKLYFCEFDQRTFRAQQFVDGAVIPPAGYRFDTDEEVIELLRRDYMLCLSMGAGLWWFDMWGGWYHSDKMCEGIKNIVNLGNKISESNQNSAAEIAFIASGESFYGVNKASGLNNDLIFNQRTGLYNMGAPFDLYSLNDLPNIDISQYKLFIFANAFDMKEEYENAINKIKSIGGKTILWMYAPGYFNGGVEKMRQLTKIDIQQETTGWFYKYTGNCGTAINCEPKFSVSDKSAQLISSHEERKLIAYKKCENYTSVYSAIGNLNAFCLQKIAKLAGVHLYSTTAPVYVNNSFIGVYATDDCVIYTKEDGIYQDMFTGEKYKAENGIINISAGKNASKMLIKID